MDKLEPLLKNRFWILLVPLLGMNLWGYFSANGALKAATKSRVETLDKVKSGIPAGSTDPNEVYTTELKNRNELLEKYVNQELLDLWKHQQTRMVWPPRVASDIPKIYLSEIKSNKVRYTYQTDYPDVVRKLHESVEPFVANKRGITWTPKVDFPVELIPRMKIGTLTIDSKQMWQAQEDIWVTQFILDAIRQMNKDADSVNSAVIRRVLAYQLLGGDGVPKGEGAAPGGGSGSADPSVMAHGAQPASFAPAQGMSGGESNSAITINPVEEFGIGGDPLAPGAGANMMGSMAAPTGDPAAPTGPAGPLRYVKDTPEAPYVERGFALSVIINQNKLVDFLVALSNSEWPVRVVRFHFGKNPFAVDPFTQAGATGGTGSNMGLSMMMRGSPGGQGGFGSGNPGATPFTNPAYTGSGPAGSGAAPGTVEVYPLDALQQPDLVQLDLLGLITMYRQPKEEIAALEAAAAGKAPAPEATAAEAPAGPAAATDPAGTATPATPAAEAGSPGATAPTPATPVTPAPGTAEPAPAGGTPAAPSGETVPAPAATTPATPTPATPAPAGAEATPPGAAPAKKP